MSHAEWRHPPSGVVICLPHPGRSIRWYALWSWQTLPSPEQFWLVYVLRPCAKLKASLIAIECCRLYQCQGAGVGNDSRWDIPDDLMILVRNELGLLFRSKVDAPRAPNASSDWVACPAGLAGVPELRRNLKIPAL